MRKGPGKGSGFPNVFRNLHLGWRRKRDFFPLQRLRQENFFPPFLAENNFANFLHDPSLNCELSDSHVTARGDSKALDDADTRHPHRGKRSTLVECISRRRSRQEPLIPLSFGHHRRRRGHFTRKGGLDECFSITSTPAKATTSKPSLLFSSPAHTHPSRARPRRARRPPRRARRGRTLEGRKFAPRRRAGKSRMVACVNAAAVVATPTTAAAAAAANTPHELRLPPFFAGRGGRGVCDEQMERCSPRQINMCLAEGEL